MKKIIGTLIVMCIISASMQAQTEKGNFLIGISSHANIGIMNPTGFNPNIMSLNFSTLKYKSDSGNDDEDKTKLTSINMAPRFGYFIIKNLAVGADFQLGYMNIKYENDEYDSDYKDSYTLFAAGPFVRYYLQQVKSILSWKPALFSELKKKNMMVAMVMLKPIKLQ